MNSTTLQTPKVLTATPVRKRKAKASALVPGEIRVCLEISMEDIEAMEYCLNEAAMADLAGQNALAFALRRVLKREFQPRVVVEKGRAKVTVGTQSMDLGMRLGRWLQEGLQGGRMEPVSAEVKLPLAVVEAGSQEAGV